jgi:hypothetical protein
MESQIINYRESIDQILNHTDYTDQIINPIDYTDQVINPIDFTHQVNNPIDYTDQKLNHRESTGQILDHRDYTDPILNPINYTDQINTPEHYTQFFHKWNWQWFTTLTFRSDLQTNSTALTFRSNLQTNSIDDLRLKWTRDLCTKENIQVAYFYALVYKDKHPHLHLLMIGSNKFGKTLFDIDLDKWTDAWPYIAHIFVPDSNIKVSGYFNKNIMSFNSDYDVYNKKLLEKTQKR